MKHGMHTSTHSDLTLGLGNIKLCGLKIVFIYIYIFYSLMDSSLVCTFKCRLTFIYFWAANFSVSSGTAANRSATNP